MIKRKVLHLIAISILLTIPSVLQAQISDRVWPNTYGEAHLCLWKDDKLGAISYTVDDNPALDIDWWIQMSNQYGFKVTWFIVTNWVNDGPRGSNPYGGTWDDWRYLYSLGHDIQSHTVNHRVYEENTEYGDGNIDYEYGESKRTLEEKIPGNVVKVLAYPSPNGYYTSPEIARNYYIGARHVNGLFNPADNIPYMSTYSVSQFNYDPGFWASIVNIIQRNPSRTRDYRAWKCMHFHGIEDKKENLIEGFEYVRQHEADLWTGLFREVVLYGQERDTAQMSVASAASDRIQLTVTDQMDDQLFDYPLTIKVRLDSSWNSISATQSGQTRGARLINHGGNRYALVDVVPDRGSVIITKSGTPPPLYGDVSENGQISAYDASLTAQSAVGIVTLTPSQVINADVTGNGSVSASDASWIAQKAVNPSIVFPVEGQ